MQSPNPNDRNNYGYRGAQSDRNNANRPVSNQNGSQSRRENAAQNRQGARSPANNADRPNNQSRSTQRPQGTQSGRQGGSGQQHTYAPQSRPNPQNGSGPQNRINVQNQSGQSGASRRPTQARNTVHEQNSHDNVGLQTSGGAAVVPVKKKNSRVSYWQKVFALSESEKKDHMIVREQGSYDYVFLIIVLVLLAFGTIMVYSSSYAYAKNKFNDSYYIIIRQALFIVAGFFGMAFTMWFRPEWYKRLAPVYYAICFGMLTLVPIPGIGVEKKGARRWIDLGFIDIQPSEFMKLGIVLMLAWYFDRYYERVTEYKNFWRSSFFGIFVPYMITGITCIMIVIEKHLSGTVIMFMIGTILIFAGGGMKRWLFGMFGGGGIALLIIGLTTNYTRRRLDLWLNPEGHEQDGAWQTLQGLYAIGSGGFFGVGIGESRQKHLYVSEPQNDFIFTIVCEELGFIGAVAVISLFMLFIYRGFVIAMRAPDTFSSLVVVGIVGKVAIQALLNIAVVTNSLPNTGISLPFFSYGGSSLIILMVEMGIVLSISRFSKQKR